MKLLVILLVFTAVSCTYAGRSGCDIPLSKEDKGLKFDAFSHASNREPYRAKLGESKAWCAYKNIKYQDYLQVNLSSLRHISAIELQGAKWSFMEYYVKTYLVRYSIDGINWKFYKSKTGSRTVIFKGNTDVSSRSVNEIHPAFVAKYIRISPLTFKNKMCTKVEVYGCNETVDCSHVIKLNENKTVMINTPSYPLPYRNDAHCNWLVYLPKPEIPLSIVAMDFDVGGSALDGISCASDTVKLYRNLHSFSKYLIGGYCNNKNKVMPREMKLSTDSLRISFTGGDNHIAKHRGFSLLLWSSQEDYKTAKACWKSTITLDCSDSEQDIEVISAFYGRRANTPVCSIEENEKNGTTVNRTFYTDSCKAPDVLPKLQTICDYRNVCKIVINDETFPHGCTSGDPLEMFVVYHCNVTKQILTTSSTIKLHSTLLTSSDTNEISTTSMHTTFTSTMKPHSTLLSSSDTYAPTTVPPTTTAAPTTAPVATTKPVEITKETTKGEHHAATKFIAHPSKDDGKSIIMIAAIAGGVFLLIMIVIAIITCICCRRRNNEKAELNKKGVVPSESTQSKVMAESDSLYEKISELDMDPVRYSEAEPKRYSPLHDARRGMSENPLYQSGGPAKASSLYNVPNPARYENHSQLHRPQSVGNPLASHTAPAGPESSCIDIKSPEELPSNSLPMIKYLEPSRTSPQDFTVTIPLERYSDSDGTGSPAEGDDVYEAMDGSNA